MGTIQSHQSTTAAAPGAQPLLYGDAALPAARIPLPIADTANARNSHGRRSTKSASVTLSTNVIYQYDDGNLMMRIIKPPPMLSKYAYDDVGNTMNLARPLLDANPSHFSRKDTAPESGFYHYGYRYYNPSTGRWPSRDPLGERGGKNLYAFVRNTPTSKIDKLGLLSLFCDKCKAGNIRAVRVSNWGLIPVSSQGNPNSVAAAMSLLKNTDVLDLVTDIGGIATGMTEAEIAEKIAEIAKSAADSGIGSGMTSGWTEQMVDAINQIQKNLGKQEGVYIDVQVSWQKCEYMETWEWGGGLPFTGRLDWKSHSNWYIDENAGTSGPSGAGFASDDMTGIMGALTASFIAALQNTSF